MKWTSGDTLSGSIDVCGGDLVTVQLTYTSGTERPTGGRPPSWRYSPLRGTDRVRDRPRLVMTHGDGSADDGLFYEHDLTPMWVPYPGTLWLRRGNGVEYGVRVYKTACYPPPPQPGWVFTLREVDTNATPLPFGTETIETSEDVTIDIVAAGEPVSLRCIAGQQIPVSNWAASGGTVKRNTFATTDVQTIICRGRW